MDSSTTAAASPWLEAFLKFMQQAYVGCFSRAPSTAHATVSHINDKFMTSRILVGCQEAGRPEAAGGEPSTPTAAVTVTLDGGHEEKVGGVTRAVLSEMMLFHLDIAIKAGRGWSDRPLEPLPEVPLAPLS